MDRTDWNIVFTKKVDLNKSDFLILFVIYLLNTFILISQLSFETLIVKNSQTISYYSIIFYFLVPLVLIFLCLFLLKIDFYEFSQNFKYLFNYGCRNYFNCVLNKWNRF